MTDPRKNYSLTALKQFEFPLLDEDIAKVEVSPSYERISCLATDGGLWILDCPSGESKLLFTTVVDFWWQLNTTSDTLLIIKSMGADICSTHQFASNFVTTNTKFSSDSQFFESSNRHRVIHCCDRLLVTLVNDSTVVCQRITSLLMYLQWAHKLPDDAVAFHTLKDKYAFILTKAKEILCFDLHEGFQVAYWKLAELVDDDILDFMFTADLNKLYVSTENSVSEIECQGESWYDFSCLLGGSRYRNFKRIRKMKTIIELESPTTLGMYRGKSLICAGQKLTLFDRKQTDFDDRVIFVSNTTRMETRTPTFLQKDRLKVLHHGITVRSILQQVLGGKGSSTAEQICKLNGWTNISMDLTVLQQGITNDHNDMIQFFFKTKLELSQSVIRSSVSHEKLRDEFSSWQAVIQQVEGKVQDGMRREFAERLTKVMVSSIAQLLHWISSVNTESPVQEEFVSYLCDKMNMFRNFLCQASTANDNVDVTDQVLNLRWDKKSEDEVIQDAIRKGTLDEVRTYLGQRTDDKDLHEKALQIGQEVVLDQLLRGETAEAYKLMESLGWDVDEKLKFFFLYVKEQEDRITLLKNIIERPTFSEDLRTLLGKMEIYLRHYTCSGAKSVLDSSIRWEPILSTGSLLGESATVLVEHHMITGTEKGGGKKYSGMILAWLMKWDKETFDNVILHSGTAQEEMKEMDTTFVWRHLLKYAKMATIERIIDGIAENTGEVYSEDLPSLLEVSSDMLDDLEEDNILPDLAEDIRLRMARKNLLCDAIIEDFPRLLNTLTKIKVSVFDLFDIEVFLDGTDYVHRMIHFCLANGFIHFLHGFLARVSISPSCCQCMTPLLNAILKYNAWKKNPESILDATLAFAKETYDANSVEDLWKKRKLKLAAIISTISNEWNVSPELLQKLPLAIAGHIQEKRGVLREDISMYQLLSRSIVFDTTKLFGFQERNTLYEGEACVLPHFMEPGLVESYGLKEPLTYVYYLLKYRPGCALECFFRNYRSTPKIVKAAGKQVVRLALHMFTDEKFVACCVAFIEGIGQESSSLRLLVAVGRRLLPRYTKHDLIENLCHVHFASLSSLTASQNAAYKESAQVILQDLDNLVREEFAEDRSRVPLLKAQSIVLLQYDFCTVHQLEMPCTILELCTETDNWLAFIVWGQVLQMSRRRIMPILKRFSNQVYREHLEKALSQVSSLKDPTTKSSLTPVKRDLRASLYNKIGVVKHQQIIDNFNYSPPEQKKDSNSDPDSFSCTSDESSLTLNTANTQGSGGERIYAANLIDLVVSSHQRKFPVNELLSAAIYHWSPAPALVATHYNENIEQCFSIWLETTTIVNHSRFMSEKCLGGLLESVENALKLRCLPSLRLGYMLFLPDSVVLPLVNYVHGFQIEKNYYSGEEHWRCFLEKFVKDKSEIEFVRKILVHAILICESVHEQRLLLKKFKTVPLDGKPDFLFFAQMLESVAEIDWELPFDLMLLTEEPEQFEDIMRREATRLIEHQHYEIAIRFSRAARLSLDDVICELLNHQLESRTHRASHDGSAGDYENSVESTANTIIEQVAQARNRHLIKRGLSASMKSSVSRDECARSIEPLVESAGSGSTDSCASQPLRRKISVLAAQTSVDLSELKEKSFWDRAHTLFRKHNISPATCFMFFKRKSEQVESDRDKFVAMKYALRWNNSEMHRTKCWQYLLKCIEGGDLEVLADANFEAEELILLRQSEHPRSRVLLESQSEKEAMKFLIDMLLSKVAFREAQFVSIVFSTTTDEYQLATSCVQLAQGLVVPDSIPTQLKDQLDSDETKRGRRVRLSISVSSESCNRIEELTSIAGASRPICRRVFLLHLLSTSLSSEYEILAKESDPVELLRLILDSSLSNKFQMAKELIAVYNIEDMVLSSFIYREIKKALDFKDKGFVEFDMLGNFEQVVSLCKDATILGNRIFYGLKKDDDIHMETDKQVLYNEVELCILAHECFSVACCMEGISHVLRHCHALVQWLVRYEKFALMIRLLTGIGRYSEMSFVFEALEEYDRFEMLFQRGMEKVPHLKVALLDYLKRKKEPSHLDTMFKLNFTMHREIAEMVLEAATYSITDITTSEESTWPESADLRQISSIIETVIMDLADAAESFVKADCLLHALDCTKRAELLSLQLHFMQRGSKTKVIKLNQETFTNWLNSHPVFCEARLVAEASQFNVAWYLPLFYQAVVAGNTMYLREFQTRMQLTPDIVIKMTDCYLKYSRPTQSMQTIFEMILNEIPDLETRYHCAKKLGFKMASKLEKNEILRDLLRASS